MRILQLCPRIPFPPVDGGTIGMYNLSNALVDAGAEVKVLAFNTKKHFISEENINSHYRETHKLETIYIDNSVKPLQAFVNLFGGRSYHIERFRSAAFSEKLRKILSESKFDVIQLDYLPVALYIDEIRALSEAKIVLRAHNVEHRIWQRLASEESNPAKAWYLSVLAKRLQQFEQEVLEKVDALVALTGEETAQFRSMGYKGPVCIAPTCFNIEPLGKITLPSAFSLFHLGAMDWRPNQEGMEWFMKDVWPKINRRMPDVKLYIAGNNMPDRFFRFNSGSCSVQGRVADAREFMLSHSVMIVPVLAGSGIRVKIVEGMALGKVIISTTLGAEGLHYAHMENIIIADTEEEIVNAVEMCYNNPALCLQIAANARKLAETYYDMKKVAADVLAFYASLKKESSIYI